jgi:ribonuclease HII
MAVFFKETETNVKINKHYKIYIDECGLGCGFSNMSACAIAWDSGCKLDLPFKVECFDSKKISEKKRNIIAQILKDNCIAYSVQFVSAKKIDEINILQARYLAYKKCVEDIENNGIYISEIFVDGNKWLPYFSKIQNTYIPHTCVIKGDLLYNEIGFASIICKTERDNYLYKICQEDSSIDEKYGIKTNKGYFSKKHLDGIQKYGLHSEHRKSYKPCRFILHNTK